MIDRFNSFVERLNEAEMVDETGDMIINNYINGKCEVNDNKNNITPYKEDGPESNSDFSLDLKFSCEGNEYELSAEGTIYYVNGVLDAGDDETSGTGWEYGDIEIEIDYFHLSKGYEDDTMIDVSYELQQKAVMKALNLYKPYTR